jgi:hypothetical protein
MSEKRGDRVYTPDRVAIDLVRFFAPSGRILEPCCGDDAILKHLPAGAMWCEIEKGRDFFRFDELVDWIITNPPFSKLRDFLRHAFRISRNVVFLIPARNLFSGYGTVREAVNAGLRMKNIRWYGTGASLGFPMGNAIAAIHWERGYAGPVIETFVEDERIADQVLLFA